MEHGIDPGGIGGALYLMPERDVNEEASRLVNDATDSELVNGEELIESEDLKRQFRESKKRLIPSKSAPPDC